MPFAGESSRVMIAVDAAWSGAKGRIDMSSTWPRISLFAAVLVAAPVLVAAAPPSAAPKSPTPSPSLKVQLGPPPIRVVGANVKGDQSSGFLNTYEKGPVTLRIEVANDGDAPAANLQLRWTRLVPQGTTSADVTMNVPAKGKATIALNDPDGVVDGCIRKPYSVQIVSPGADNRVRDVFVVPSCMFTTKLSDSLTMMTPDRAYEARQGRASLANAKLGGPMTCGNPFAITADVVNKAPAPGNDLLLHFTEGDGSSLADSKATDVGAGATAATTVTSYQHHGRLGPMRATLTDPKSSLGGKVTSQELLVDVRRQCVLNASLE